MSEPTADPATSQDAKQPGPRWLWLLAAAVLAACGEAADPAPPALKAGSLRAAPPLDATALMNWAEQAYAEYFPGHGENQFSAPYVYRYYPDTGNYLGIDGQTVRVLGPSFGADVVTVGVLADFTCRVYPTRCMPLTANAGAAQSVKEGTTVTLDGSASSDPDGSPLTYAWTLTSKPAGSVATLVGADGPHPTFTADVTGDYAASLVVNNGALNSQPGTVAVKSRKNYLATSYALAQSAWWFSSLDLTNSDGSPYVTQNPLQVMQTVQVDLNYDGVDDLFTFDSYPMDVAIPNPPPSTFINNGTKLAKAAWTGASMRKPHGVKILVGDFNNDGWPDLFSLVAIDPPHGAFPDLLDFNSVLFGSANGFTTIKEFDDKVGFWYAGASGDIDNDGDLDIVMFNFHNQANGVKSQILWNDGTGHFTYDARGIGDIPLVDQAEFADINGDGYLDLVIDNIDNDVRKVSVLWGNGKGYSLANATSFTIPRNNFVSTLNFADLDGDGTQEIILSGSNDRGSYWVALYQSGNHGAAFTDKTSQYFDMSEITQRFDHLVLRDIDRNGKLDLFAPDRKDNIRWAWNGSKFIKQ